MRVYLSIVLLIRGLDVSRPGEVDDDVSILQVHRIYIGSFDFHYFFYWKYQCPQDIEEMLYHPQVIY